MHPSGEPAPIDGLQQRPAPQLHSASAVRLLVLDDDPAICRLIKAALGQHDFIIDTVCDPTQMETQLREAAYHLIILDYVIPGLDPEHLLDAIKEHQAEASIVVITAFPSMDSALHCLRAHTYDYLTKPFQVDQLQRTVTRCLEGRGLLRLSEEALCLALGNAIRDRRKALGLTLAQMAERTGVSLGYLSQIELGKNSASIETLYKIALGLRLRIADLFQTVQPPN
jgi:CheY-like chemotaxis protein/DNA-binding XRE family transcriptional regulator